MFGSGSGSASISNYVRPGIPTVPGTVCIGRTHREGEDLCRHPQSSAAARPAGNSLVTDRMMKSVLQSGWGGREQLSVGEVPRPIPKMGEVLVRVAAVSVNAGDHHALTGRPYLVRLALSGKKIPGMDFSGTVDRFEGIEQTKYSEGDAVFGTVDVACGAFAEYVSVPAKFLSRKPQNVSWEEAAALPTAGMTALQALRTGGPVTQGNRVLINGASSGVGTFAVQLAKSMGAHVTGVCSGDNVEMVRSLGADVVIDYRREDVLAASLSARMNYDKIIDAAGRTGWRRLLNPKGALVAVALPNPESECIPCQLCSLACSPYCCCCLSSKKSHPFMQSVKSADMDELAQMVADDKLRPVLGLRLAGIDALPDALAGHSSTLGQGHRKGKTVVTLSVESESMDRE